MSEPITIEQAGKIAETVLFRQEKFDETLEMSMMVVLLNYGNEFVKVVCTQGEWEGIKADLEPGPGIPACPNGHPLFETSGGKRLGLVEVSTPGE